MNYSVIITVRAKSDLKEIFKYIAFDLRSVQNATSQIDRLEKAIGSLGTMPGRCRIFDSPPWRERKLRVMTVDNYLVFYISSHENLTVTVLRIMYGGRNVDSQLNEQSELEETSILP